VKAPRALLVHNPSAGSQETERKPLARLIEARLEITVKSCSSKKPGLEARLAEPWDLVIAAGGDGTIAKVAKLLTAHEAPPTLAILPLGTANNIAQSLGVQGETDDIVAGWDIEKRKPLAFGMAKAHWGEQPFIEGVGMGPLAQATTPKEKGKKTRAQRIEDGRFAFRHALREAVAQRLYVTVDGERIEDEVLLVEVLNIRQVGPRLRLAPKADAADDLLDVVTVPARRRAEMIAWVDALIEAGSEAETLPRPPVTALRGRNVVIAWNGMELRIDDKFPLMPGQTAPLPPTAEDESAAKVRADLLSLQIAERKLTMLAPPKTATPRRRQPR
jgi:diacylglycerol kinase family enzyme